MDNQDENQSLKYTLLSSIILALVNTGDAFLYAYLPSNYQSIGLSLIWVGLILSINRFTRLFLNGWVAFYLSKKGIRSVTIFTTLIAVITTVAYGFISSIFLWILVRILWGISFSTLRLGSSMYAMQYKKRGIALGLSRGIIELGAVFSLLMGPILLHHFDRGITFLFFGLISLVAFFIALSLPILKTEIISKKDLTLSFPSSFNMMVLINAFVIEGVLVVLVSRIVQIEYQLSPEKILFFTGILLGYRRVCLVFFSPVAGWFADKFSFEKVFVSTSILLTFGIILISLKIGIIGIITVFTFGAMNASIASGGALTTQSRILKDVTDNATWRDIGTAFGSLVGALLLSLVNVYPIFMIATALLTVALMNHQFKLFIIKI